MTTTIAPPPSISLPPDVRGNGGSARRPGDTHRTGILLTLAAIAMMFIGLTSAYVVSQGLDPLWKQVQLLPLISINTAVLLLSSYCMEQARRGTSVRWLLGTLVLGLTFLAGQLGVFSQLAHAGLYLSTGRQAAFYYVLTGLHGLHILGGIIALGWTAIRMSLALPSGKQLEVTSLYWHFMGGLWLYLLLVIFL